MKIDPMLILVTPTVLCYRVDPNCLLLLQPNWFFWSIHSPFLKLQLPGVCLMYIHMSWQG